MIRTFEYKVFNMSEAVAPKTFIDVLNDYGREGWQVLFPLTSTRQSFLMIRERRD